MDQNWRQIQTSYKQTIFGNQHKSMNNQQNGHIILWLTWRKYETMYRLSTCNIEVRKWVDYNEIQNFQTFVSPQASALLPHIRFLQTFANVCKCCLNDEGSMPSSIYSWSIGHILEHEFFSLGRLGGKEKKWIWGILSNLWGWLFQLLVVKIIFKFF